MSLSRSDLAIAIFKTGGDGEKILKIFNKIVGADPATASAESYPPLVAKGLPHPEPRIVAATIRTLASFGPASLDFVGEIGGCLSTPDTEVQLAAIEALGSYGYDAQEYAPKVASMIQYSDDSSVKVAAITMLGNVMATDEAGTIKPFLTDSNEAMACAACEALGKMGMMSGDVDVLGNMLKKVGTCGAAVSALAGMGASAPVSLLGSTITEGLGSDDSDVRSEAVMVIGALAAAALQEPNLGSLKKVLSSSTPGPRAAAAMAFGAMGPKAAQEADALESLLMDNAEETAGPQGAAVLGTAARRSPAACRIPKAAVLSAFGQMKAKKYIGQIAKSLSDSNWEVRVAALEALAAFGGAAKEHAQAVAGALDDAAFPARAAAAMAIGQMGAENHIADVAAALSDSSHSVRLSAVLALAEFGEKADNCTHDVFKLLQDPVVQVQAAAVRCLSYLGTLGGNYAGVMATLLTEADPELRTEIIDALGRMGKRGQAFAEDIGDCVMDSSQMVSDAAVRVLMGMGPAGKQYLRTTGYLPPLEGPTALPAEGRALPGLTKGNKGYLSALEAERAALGLTGI